METLLDHGARRLKAEFKNELDTSFLEWEHSRMISTKGEESVLCER